MTEFPITIYHNPECGTSRNVVDMIRAVGYEPELVDYRKVGWSRKLLEELIGAMGATPRDVLRDKGTAASALGLLGPGVSEDEILTAMIEYPILVNRPIVVTPLGTKLCRPSETVFSLLDRRPTSFTKEDGQTVRFDGKS
jgi:arsenate reductase